MEYLNEVKLNGVVHTPPFIEPKYVMFKLKCFKKYKNPITINGKLISGKGLYIDCKAFVSTTRHVMMAQASKLKVGEEVYVRGELTSWFKKSESGYYTVKYYLTLLEINQPKPLEEFVHLEDEVTQRVYNKPVQVPLKSNMELLEELE